MVSHYDVESCLYQSLKHAAPAVIRLGVALPKFYIHFKGLGGTCLLAGHHSEFADVLDPQAKCRDKSIAEIGTLDSKLDWQNKRA